MILFVMSLPRERPHTMNLLVWSGLVWSGLVWSGLVWSGLGWCVPFTSLVALSTAQCVLDLMNGRCDALIDQQLWCSVEHSVNAGVVCSTQYI